MIRSSDIIFEEAKRDMDRSEARINRELDEQSRRADRLSDNSTLNYKEWRDFLHKYFTVVAALIGATGILKMELLFSSSWAKWGIFLALGGVLCGYLFVNIYFWLERKWLYGDNLFESVQTLDFLNHPESDGDEVNSVQLYIRDKIKQAILNKNETKDKKEIKKIKQDISGLKKERLILNFVGQQFFLLERVWLLGVVLSFLLTAIGIIFIFVGLTNNPNTI